MNTNINTVNTAFDVKYVYVGACSYQSTTFYVYHYFLVEKKLEMWGKACTAKLRAILYFSNIMRNGLQNVYKVYFRHMYYQNMNMYCGWA